MADARAFEIFVNAIHFDRPLRQILGEIYIMGVRAGISVAGERSA